MGNLQIKGRTARVDDDLRQKVLWKYLSEVSRFVKFLTRRRSNKNVVCLIWKIGEQTHQKLVSKMTGVNIFVLKKKHSFWTVRLKELSLILFIFFYYCTGCLRTWRQYLNSTGHETGEIFLQIARWFFSL